MSNIEGHVEVHHEPFKIGHFSVGYSTFKKKDRVKNISKTLHIEPINPTLGGGFRWDYLPRL